MVISKFLNFLQNERGASWSYGSWIYNYLCNQLQSALTVGDRITLSRGVLVATLCYKVCQSLATGRWFSPDTPVSSGNKTDRHDITEILLNWSGVKHHNPINVLKRIVTYLFWEIIESHNIVLKISPSSCCWHRCWIIYMNALQVIDRT
jgi:hypothetical protein